MQTFLPFADFKQSAEALDRQRLGKQRIEVKQLLDALHEIKTGWRNHTVTAMWRGFEPQLAEFGIICCEEWKSRGYNDTTQPEIEYHLDIATSGDYNMERPPWFGDPVLHDSYKSLLLRKCHNMTDDQVRRAGFGRDFYDDIFAGIPDDLPFVYPTLGV